MRKLSLWLLSFLFGLSASVSLLLLLAYLLFGQPQMVKNSLVQSHMYNEVVYFVQGQLNQLTKQQPQMKALTDPIIHELKPSYLQNKIEKFLNDTYSFAQGGSNTLPVITLSDFKKQLIAKNPSLARLPAEISDIFDQRLGPSEEQGQQLRRISLITQQALYISTALSLVFLILLFLLGQTLAQRFKILGKEILKIALPGAISTLIAWLILWFVPNPHINLPENVAFLQKPIIDFSILLTKELLIYSALLYGGLTILGAILILISKKTNPPTAANTPVAGLIS
ncbi:hypothetical protein HY224_03410 [Candidatus Uhrbacteria bacterium]|nr:hypothetical protein [Candidatus Uhrbacteria bacterium]